MGLRAGTKAGGEMTPKEAKGLSRLAKMRQGRQAFKRAHWPGDPETVFDLVVLSCTDVQLCHAEAHLRFEELKLPLNTYFVQLFQDELLTQVLFRAMRDPEDRSKPFAESVEDLRDNTEVDQRADMFADYEQFRIEVDPNPYKGEMDPETLSAVLAALGKGDASALRAFGSDVLASFLLTTAGAQSTSPTPRSGPSQ